MADAELTSYPDVNAILRLLLDGVRAILRDQLVGLYLYGSLSLGDFDPDSSDVDFLAVTAGDLADPVLDALRDLHERIAASGLRYATKLEGSYIPRDALRRYDPGRAEHPTIGIDWDFGIAQHGSNWIAEREIVRTHGVTVWGPSPATLIDPVPPADLKAAVCESLRDFWSAQLHGPDWLKQRDYQAFAILTMCRALYTLYEGKVASKPTAAAWARRMLDPRWEPLIDRALNWRRQHQIDDLTDLLEFMRFAIDAGLKQCR